MVTNLIDVKTVKVLDNDFRILMNISLERLIAHKLDFHFSTNFDREKAHTHLIILLLLTMNQLQKKKKEVLFLCSR